jgi:DNA polymerase III subunit gamma/tau
MSLALYRKYRSRTLDEIVGQTAVTVALKNALKSNQLSHAYLFTGPRGVGKTSIARILGFEINKLPYSDNLPLDIIEIDAASNNGVEKTRELIERVSFAPVSAKFKVYIIDEVHMLSTASFNALLKTLEEPPAHVIFILATTESHKIPETILSRTQHYSFKFVDEKTIAAHIKEIANKESIQIDDEALELVARHSGGSLRDSLSLLDQIRHASNAIDAPVVRDVLGLPTENVIALLMEALVSGESPELMNELETAYSGGITASQIAHELLGEIRNLMTGKKVTKELLGLAEELLLVPLSSRPDIQLELATIGYILSQHPEPAKPAPIHRESPKPSATVSPPREAVKKDPEPAAPEHSENIPIVHPKAQIVEKNVTVSEDNLWDQLLGSLRATHNTIYSILRMCKPTIDEAQKIINLEFKFPFHQKRINESKNKQVLLDQLDKLGFTSYQIQAVVKDRKPTASNETTLEPFVSKLVLEEDNPVLGQIRNVFGSAEVLE